VTNNDKQNSRMLVQTEARDTDCHRRSHTIEAKNTEVSRSVPSTAGAATHQMPKAMLNKPLFLTNSDEGFAVI
jgi:hypothetical protein